MGFKSMGRETRVAIAATGLLVLASSLAGCSSARLGFLDPHGPVAQSQHDQLLDVVLLLAIFVALPIFVILPWFAWRYRYRARGARYAPKWSYYGPLEVATWGGPLVIVAVLSILVWRSTHALDPYKPIASSVVPLRVQVIGYDWKWLFIYPDAGVASVGELALPVGRPVVLTLTSATVMQSLQIPALGGQIYAMGGMVTQLNLEASQAGQFMGENTMYNGDGFHQQHFTAVAMTPTAFLGWVHNARTQGLPMNSSALALIARRSTRAELVTALTSGRAANGNVYLKDVPASFFSAVVATTGTGKPMSLPADSAAATNGTPGAAATTADMPMGQRP
jgi:cytochrome o ubiquinol oxidase subunit 2